MDSAAMLPANPNRGFWESASKELDRVHPGILMLAEASKPELLRLNAKEYKLNGLRFDAMGPHFVYNMVDIRTALNAPTLNRDGVDGSKIYMYGEDFQIAEAANHAIGPNASQINPKSADPTVRQSTFDRKTGQPRSQP